MALVIAKQCVQELKELAMKADSSYTREFNPGQIVFKVTGPNPYIRSRELANIGLAIYSW